MINIFICSNIALQSAIKKIFFNLFSAVPGLCCCAGFSLVSGSGGYSSCSVRVSHGGGFSFCGAQTLGHMYFSSCGTWAQ